jgi:hypothetical protein
VKTLSFILLLFTAASPATAQLRIFSFEAKNHVGDTVQVDGITVSTERNAKEKLTYVYFGHKAPLQELTVLINDADLRNFPGAINKLFTQKFATVKGKVQLIKNRPTIIARNTDDFSPGPGQ